MKPTVLFICAFVLLSPGLLTADEPPQLQALQIVTGQAKTEVIPLAGRDAGHQLIVLGQLANGRARDVTRTVKYTVNPPAVATVDASGWLSAQQEGEATIQVQTATGVSTKLRVAVTQLTHDVPINFANDVVPILTRYGCNAGGCHGKAGGQSGFALSLLGFEPGEDYDYLVKEGRGRRVVATVPEMSLLLRKASGQVAHGGGVRIHLDSPAYRILHRWIAQGAPLGQRTDPVVTRIQLVPAEAVLQRGEEQQLAVVAHYSDGTMRDVTRLAQYDTNDMELAEVSPTGLLATKSLGGIVAVMARFQTHVAVMRATVPLGAPIARLPPRVGFVDELVAKQWQKLGLPPSDLCDDATFVRRVTIDIAGRLPTLAETEAFLADKDAAKRVSLVERLLASPDYADCFASKWSAVLRNKRHSLKDDIKPTFAFHEWIRGSLQQNKPFDQLVREILTATGEEVQNPPVAWYREVRDAPAQVEDVAQLFLGTRLGCARCHHHPLEKWSQQDYYGLAAFFGQLAYRQPPKADPKDKKKPTGKAPTHIEHKEGLAKAKNPRTSKDVLPTVLGGEPLAVAAAVDPRTRLAEWMTQPENPYLARTLVNRYWKHFLGRGLVEPEDDLRATNPASNPELLDALARDFSASKYDLKKLIQTICTSSVYQLSAEPNEHNRHDKQNYARFLPRRLHAEVLFDAIDQVTLTKTAFPGVPEGTRAVQLPDNAFESYFLTLFGRPDGSSACECERSSEVGLSHMLHLMNSQEVLCKISGIVPVAPKLPKGGKVNNTAVKLTPGQRLARLLADKRSHEDKIRELYLLAYCRPPQPAELTALLRHLEQRRETPREAYEDILWVLLNSEEFLFNH